MTLHLYFYDPDPSHHHLLLYLTGTGTISPPRHSDHWSQRILKEGSITEPHAFAKDATVLFQCTQNHIQIPFQGFPSLPSHPGLSPSNQLDFPSGPWTHLTPPHFRVITPALPNVLNSSKAPPPAWVKSLFQEVCSAQLRFSTHFL